MIKLFEEFINEAAKGYTVFTLNDMIDNGVWTPNDDLTSRDYIQITNNFYHEYPFGMSDESDVEGYPVQCAANKQGVTFSCFFDNTSENKKVAVVKAIVNVLINTVYSTCGSDVEIKNMLKKL